ncbi:Uncharacterised protein [Vibrio cholerae]|uniref:Uncharacterized protein n=1 Tax=Vibrio cholerae TaxID=666 RepID=A0A655QJ53_VIBCL|nr:Uncharacterised protein [Vibrio cholerae]CSC40697.1 Uncharacterised protein [Vibrio cholerae]CSC94239.1 Uncharacterised protein [Vibrio cholerae]
MNELVDGMQLRHGRYFLFQEVFHGFYIVVGGAFNLFDTECIRLIEVGGNRIKELIRFGTECRHFCDLSSGG